MTILTQKMPRATRRGKFPHARVAGQLLAAVPEALFIVDEAGIITYANDAAIDLLSPEFPEVSGRAISDLLTPVAEPVGDSADHAPLPGFGGSFMATALLMANHARLPVHVKSTLCQIDKKSYMLLTVRDVSAQLVTGDEAHSRTAMALADIKKQVLGSIAVGVVHTMSQPLSALRLSIEVLERQMQSGEDLAECDELLQQVQGMIHQMTEVVQETRELAERLADARLQPVDLIACLSKARRQCDYVLCEHHVQVAVTAESPVYPVTANPIALEMAFITLIHYGLKKHLDAAAEAGDEPLRFEFRNIDLGWVEVYFSFPNGEPADSAAAPAERAPDASGDGNDGIEIDAIRVLAASLGGDFCETAEGILIRLPAKSDDERAQLINMMQLMHS